MLVFLLRHTTIVQISSDLYGLRERCAVDGGAWVWYDGAMQIQIALPTNWDADQYALLDSGADYKLERFGGVVLARPEPQAIWGRHLDAAAWDAADATFSRDAEAPGAHWTPRHELPETWPITWRGLTFLARLTPFKHTGVFPEQAAHWEWIADRVANANRSVRVLNLFGYTGAASLVAAQAGAQVTHVDASPKVIEWARDSQAASDMQEAPIRWITDDALKFVRREARRDARYDLIIMDPPAFGRGAKGEIWKFETSLPQLLEACRDILSPRPIGILINSYSIRASALLLANLLDELVTAHRVTGTVTAGELVLPEHDSTRLLSTAIYARWEAK